MRYTLEGTLHYSRSNENSRASHFTEYFDSEDLNTAVLIAKAMIQSHKINNEKRYDHTDYLSAVLKNPGNKVVWKARLVDESYSFEVHEMVSVPEHFDEEFVPL